METQKTSSSQGNLEIKEQWEWGGCWIDWEVMVRPKCDMHGRGLAQYWHMEVPNNY